MTAPRQVLAGTTYLVTRRCSQRQFLLRPGRTTNQVFLYLLALAARRYGVKVHAYCVLSNHFHMVVTDPSARLPAFHQFLDALVARALNAALGRWENFWAPDSFSAVALMSPGDVLDKAAYVLANPVAAGLVRRGRQWPGLWSAPELVGGAPIEVTRPQHFFDPKGQLPESTHLEVCVPPGFESSAAFREALSARLLEHEQRAIRSCSGEVVGVARVLAQRATGRPLPGEPHRRLNPRVAGRDRRTRIAALDRLLAFYVAYREAWTQWRRGMRHVIFPAGTYLLRVVHGVPCGAG